MTISNETGYKLPIVTVYILKNTEKEAENVNRTDYETVQKMAQMRLVHEHKTPKLQASNFKTAMLTKHTSQRCTDKQTDKQTDRVVT